ncbi:MAG TPA: creatininase family protein [Syntrophorhabdus sp.]|jgi:creatinine amidohydrolase|nr:creatininase family protein [Syntrophorhabdus sp.]HPB37573.1 creatininase family protein [Syntrophorhabdus sp.]HQO62403.1 creatininase family protein [Syntrophorhabdus sp.]
MDYSIFSGTMADMTYLQIEEAARKKLPVLFPIGVIEEHGPHMCLGTDVYLAYNLAKDVQKGLRVFQVESIIAPAYYWGINAAMNGFAGSFSVKPETMVSVLFDLLKCLKNWSFEYVFLLNVHGDFEHNLAMTEAVRKAYDELRLRAYSIVPEFFRQRANMSGKEPYIILYDVEFNKSSPYLDIHAGAFETSLMVEKFPNLVDIDTAQSLPSSETTIEGLKKWLKGGSGAREVTPLGYLGDPSAIDVRAANESNEKLVNEIVKAINTTLTKE